MEHFSAQVKWLESGKIEYLFCSTHLQKKKKTNKNQP